MRCFDASRPTASLRDTLCDASKGRKEDQKAAANEFAKSAFDSSTIV